MRPFVFVLALLLSTGAVARTIILKGWTLTLCDGVVFTHVAKDNSFVLACPDGRSFTVTNCGAPKLVPVGVGNLQLVCS